jgi:1,4-dihydroxy-2-naphthoyl-CoA hydrolase
MTKPTTDDNAATDDNDDNDNNVTWSKVMGVQIVKASAGEVIAEIEVGPQHLQSFGLVHGGVHAGLIETVASMGATISARARGQAPPVGLENHTSFVRATSAGRLRATAKPVTSGRSTQLWEATIVDEKNQVLATGRVRVMCREKT